MRVGQLDIVADELVALRRDHDDVALGIDLAGLAVPDDLVGGEVIALAVHAHFAAGGHDVGVVVVSDLVGAELDDLGPAGAAVAGASMAPGLRGDAGGSDSSIGSADHQTNLVRNAVCLPTHCPVTCAAYRTSQARRQSPGAPAAPLPRLDLHPKARANVRLFKD